MMTQRILSVPQLVGLAAEHVRRVDALTAKKMRCETPGVLIDVRESVESQALPTKNSINIPRGVLEMKIAELCPDAQAHIYIHCATGGRATLAAEQLQRMGYQQVTVIACNAQELVE